MKEVRLREPNVFVEAKANMKRWELVLWLYALKEVKVDREELERAKKEGRLFLVHSELSLKEVAEYIAMATEEEGEGIGEKEILDYTAYFRKVLAGMVNKTLFEVEVEKLRRFFEEYGYGYMVSVLGLDKAEEGKPVMVVPIGEVIKERGDRLRVNFTATVSPLVAEFKKWFTTYRLEEIARLRQKNALILYRLVREKLGLKQKKFRLEVEEVKRLFSTKLKSSDIRSKVLKPAVEEVNRKTALKVEVKPIRAGKGGKIVAFDFKVMEKSPVPTTEELLKNKQSLQTWLKTTLNHLVKLFEKEGENLTETSLSQALLSFQSVHPSTALWFLLHFTDSKLLYAWQILKQVDENNELKLKEKFLHSLLPNQSKEFSFLLDPRIKPLVEEILLTFSPHLPTTDDSLLDKIKLYWSKLPESGKKELLSRFNASSLNDLLKLDPQSVFGYLKVLLTLHLH